MIRGVHQTSVCPIFQVVGALGDSITVGVGARAESVLDIAQEYRGVSFSIGNNIRTTLGDAHSVLALGAK